MTRTFVYHQPFQLESGQVLPQYHLAYTALGELNEAGNNVVWVFHALTANSDPSDWWYGLVGPGRLFDPARHYIVCVNMPGSCYGSLSPLDLDPGTGSPYYHSFPLITTRDMIRMYQPLRRHLGISTVWAGLGGSMGGQQLLEWAVEEPSLFEHIIPIATNAQHSPWGIAFNASQRFCIEADPTWKQLTPSAGLDGMKVARSVALLSYRNYHTYVQAQQGRSPEADGEAGRMLFRAETYQRYQGEKLAKRFQAFSYYFLSASMDSHDLGRGRGSMAQALGSITARTLVISISSDLLFPPVEQQFLRDHIRGARLEVIESYYGHDGFLLEFEAIGTLASQFLREQNLPQADFITLQTTTSTTT